MENALYVALSRQMILRREMDVVANNIANADTAGFKVESVISETSAKSVATDASGLGDLQFAVDVALARDFTQGALTRTGAPMDVAIEGDGFFQINTAQGARFTRDGRFGLNAEGLLVTSRGDAVADSGGGEIALDPSKGEPSISRDGVISQDGVRIGKIGVWRFGSLSSLSKDGDGLYRNDANQAPQAANDAIVRQGTIEGSNVQPVIEVTRMIEISREYERIAKMIDQNADLDRRAVERLGKVS